MEKDKEDFNLCYGGKMKRILIFVVETQEDGKTIREFLKKCAIFSEKEIRALKFRENGICVNGERKRVTYVLKKGETLELSIEEEEKGSHQMVRLDCALDVLYEDQDIFVVNKPAGILVHPVGGHYEDTLSNMAAAYFEKKGEHVVIRPVGRLDKDTSGAVLFAKNRIAAARLSAPGSGFEKEYFALVQGTFPAEQQSGEIHTPLSQCPGHPLKMCPDFVHGKEAHTFYEVVRAYPRDCTLLKVRITTGRTHQIRVHMASIGHPLLGDVLYGKAPAPKDQFQRTALHAAKLSFSHPVNQKDLEIIAPFPEDFQNFFM